MPRMQPAVRRLLGHRAEFLAYLRKQGASDAQAEDLLQSALVRGLEPWAAAPADEKLVPWFYRVLRNALIDDARRAAAAGRALARYAHEAPDAHTPVEARRICRCAHQVLAALKPTYAELVEQVDLGGVSVEDAARRAGITPNHAYVRLHRARKALRERLESICGQCATGEGRCSDCYCQPNEPL